MCSACTPQFIELADNNSVRPWGGIDTTPRGFKKLAWISNNQMDMYIHGADWNCVTHVYRIDTSLTFLTEWKYIHVASYFDMSCNYCNSTWYCLVASLDMNSIPVYRLLLETLNFTGTGYQDCSSGIRDRQQSFYYKPASLIYQTRRQVHLTQKQWSFPIALLLQVFFAFLHSVL